MNAFAETLASLSARLDLPEPARRRVLLEVAADLADLRDRALAAGLDEDAARQRALELAELDDASIGALASVHAGRSRRLLESLAPSTRSRVEQVGLVVVLGALAALTAQLLANRQLTTHAGPFAWASLALVVAALGLGAARTWTVRIRRDERSAPARRTAERLRAVAQLQFVVAAVGLAVSVARSWTALDDATNADAAALLHAELEALRSECALVSLTGLAAAFTLFAWRRAATRAEFAEQRELELLLELDSRPTPLER